MSKKFIRMFVGFSIGLTLTLLVFILIANIYGGKKNNKTTDNIITPSAASFQEPVLKIYTLCGCRLGDDNGKTVIVDGYCPNHFLVRLIDDYIYIYQSDNTQRPIEILTANTSQLSDDDKRQLKDYMFFRTRDEMLMFLEGVTY